MKSLIIKRQGITLIELLITTSLISMMGLAIYSAFATGLEVWQRGTQVDHIERDAKLELEKIAKELRNSFDFKGLKFEGSNNSITFPAYLRVQNEEGEYETSIGTLQYFYDDSKRKIYRREITYQQLYRIFREPEAVVVFPFVEGIAIQYYSFDSVNKVYTWLDNWEQQETSPLAIRFKMALGSGEEVQEFDKVVFLPLKAGS